MPWTVHFCSIVLNENLIKPLCDLGDCGHYQSEGNHLFQAKYLSFKGEHSQQLSTYWCVPMAARPTGSRGFKAFQENALSLLLRLRFTECDIIYLPAAAVLLPRHVAVLTAVESLKSENGENLVIKSHHEKQFHCKSAMNFLNGFWTGEGEHDPKTILKE